MYLEGELATVKHTNLEVSIAYFVFVQRNFEVFSRFSSCITILCFSDCFVGTSKDHSKRHRPSFVVREHSFRDDIREACPIRIERGNKKVHRWYLRNNSHSEYVVGVA